MIDQMILPLVVHADIVVVAAVAAAVAAVVVAGRNLQNMACDHVDHFLGCCWRTLIKAKIWGNQENKTQNTNTNHDFLYCLQL